MKISDGFDARRLRPRTRKAWHVRLGVMIGALLWLIGIALALLGALGLAGGELSGELTGGREGSLSALFFGLFCVLAGWLLWRRCRRRLRQQDALNLSPHLFKKRG